MQVAINGMTMTYEEYGSGPAVLLLHGLTAYRRLWKSHIQPLRLAGYRVIVPDLCGFSESAAPDVDYSIDFLSEEIVGLLNYLGIGRVALVGLSLGGPVLHTLLQRYPQRFAAAVIVEPRIRKGDNKGNECLMDLLAQRRVNHSLLDFLNGVKRFRPRYQWYRQVA